MTPSVRLVTLTLGLLVAPLTATTQPPRQVPRIAFLSVSFREAITDDRFEAFQQELRALGYVEGQTIAIEFHWAQLRLEQLQALAAELVRRQVAVIVSLGPGATRAAKNATSTIPIIMADDSDPVGDGFVASLGRPGGNITGLSGMIQDLSTKRLELLKETVPGMTRVAVLWNPIGMFAERELRETEEAARTLA